MAKTLVKNIGFLSLSQLANYVLPLITIPYITRVVGPENYGLIEFAGTVMLYFTAVVIYGFTYSSTRRIAANPRDPRHVNRIFITTLQSRLFLLAVSALIFVPLLLAVPQFYEHRLLFLYAFPIVIGWALYPDFLFQGLQKLAVIALANTGIKVLAAVLIFTLLREKSDYYLVVGINAVAQISAALATLFYARRVLPELHWQSPRWLLIKAYLKSGWYMFLSLFFVRVSSFGTLLFLGFLLSELKMGYYAAAVKLIFVAQSFMLMPFSGALFPYLANQLKLDPALFLKAHRRFMLFLTAICLIASIGLYAFHSFFIHLIFGQAYAPAERLLQIMSPIIALSAISHFAMKQGLMVLREDRLHLYLVVFTGLLSTAINLALIKLFDLEGAAWARLSVEMLLALCGWITFRFALARRTRSGLPPVE